MREFANALSWLGWLGSDRVATMAKPAKPPQANMSAKPPPNHSPASTTPKPSKSAAPGRSFSTLLAVALAALLGWLAPQPSFGLGAGSAARSSFAWADHSPRDCDESTLQIRLDDAERRAGVLSEAHTQLALATFAACGVVVIEEAVPADEVAAFRSRLDERLAPHLASRRRVRDALKRAMVERHSLKALWEGGESERGRRVQDEEMFTDGRTVRERNSGRLDVELPWRGPPFGSDGFAHNPFARAVLSVLLGASHRLHSTHAVVSLGGLEAEEQHWHRDNDLLFEGDQQGRGAVGEGQPGGQGAAAAVPPYAINVFVPLLPQRDAARGPTQFALGSHRHSRDGLGASVAVANRTFAVGAGSLIIADYRTLHRGLRNVAADQQTRPIAMLIYGRRWWSDTENYAAANYGGFAPPRRHDRDDEEGLRETLLTPLERADDSETWTGAAARRTLFFGLVNRWEASLRRELDAEYGRRAR